MKIVKWMLSDFLSAYSYPIENPLLQKVPTYFPLQFSNIYKFYIFFIVEIRKKTNAISNELVSQKTKLYSMEGKEPLCVTLPHAVTACAPSATETDVFSIFKATQRTHKYRRTGWVLTDVKRNWFCMQTLQRQQNYTRPKSTL